jgi:hypothetical protein
MHTPRRLAAFAPVLFAATLVACGSSTSTATSPTASASVPSTAVPTVAPTAAPTDTPTAALAGLACPDEGTVNAAFGLTVAAPISVPAADLPAGSTGIVCTYSGSATSQAVVVDLATGPAITTTSFITMVEAGEQQAAQAQGSTFSATDVSGVGDQAAVVTVSAAGSPTENGIIAVSGTTGVVLTGKPPLSQSQLQSFASQLLG